VAVPLASEIYSVKNQPPKSPAKPPAKLKDHRSFDAKLDRRLLTRKRSSERDEVDFKSDFRQKEELRLDNLAGFLRQLVPESWGGDLLTEDDKTPFRQSSVGVTNATLSKLDVVMGNHVATNKNSHHEVNELEILDL